MQKLLFIASFFLLMLLRVGGVDAQWVQTNGPVGDNNTEVSRVDSTLFATPFFRSKDHGTHWGLMDKGQIRLSGQVIKYAGIIAGTTTGIYNSQDGGDTWNFVSPIQATHLAVLGSKIVAAYTSAYQSEDGLVWHPLYGLPSFSWTRSIVSTGGNFLLYVDDGFPVIYRSTDSTGMEWVRVYRGSRQALYGDGLLVQGHRVYAGTDSGLLISTDSGKSWNLQAVDFNRPITQIGSSGNFLLAGTDSGVYRSSDEGIHWERSLEGPIQQDRIDSYTLEGDYILAGTSSGVYRSSDSGKSWSSSSTGLVATFVSSIFHYGTYLFASTGRVSRSNDAGLTWEDLDSRVLPADATFASDGSELYSLAKGRVFLSSDSGRTWTPTGINKIPGLRLSCLASFSGVCLAGDKYGVYRSVDTGRTWALWDSMNLPYVLSMYANRFFVLAGTTKGIYRRSSQGIWEHVWCDTIHVRDSVGKFIRIDSIQCDINVLEGNGETHFAGIQNKGLLRSMDGGRTWNFILNGLPPSKQVWSVVRTGHLILAALDDQIGIYASTDEGDSWHPAGLGLPPGALVLSLDVDSNYAYAGTGFSGVWRRPLSEMIAKAAVAGGSSIEHAISAYPNPITSVTTIAFSTTGGYLDISIHNLLGTEVSRLFSGELSVGEHSFTWDARGVPPGMYECVVRMDGRVERVPMMVVR